MELKIKKLSADALLPSYAHSNDAGMDVFTPVEFSLEPGERKLIPLGFAMEFSDDHVARCLDKSGLASKHGIHTLAGVMDASYRGEINVALINLGQEPYTFSKGDKIAQIVMTPISHASIIEVDTLSETTRGEGGFGSTGK